MTDAEAEIVVVLEIALKHINPRHGQYCAAESDGCFGMEDSNVGPCDCGLADRKDLIERISKILKHKKQTQ